MLEILSATSPQATKADVCIAGAGPAGIVLALTLAEAGVTSVVLEGGPLDFPEERDRDLYQGESTGLPYPLAASRLRYFGGTSGHWGGWCKPLDRIDFESHPNSELPSWPLTLDELSPHYARALDWCEISSPDFDAASSVEDASKHLLFEPGMDFTQRLFRFSPPTRFGTRYRGDFESSESIHCFYQANLVSISHSGDRIVSARAASLDGRTLDIEAEHFILAMGGIETARFLLHTRDDRGVPFGNASGLLGQTFMEHFGFSPGYMTAPAGLRLYRHRSGKSYIQPVITYSGDFQREHRLPSACLIASERAPSLTFPEGYFLNPGTLQQGISGMTRYHLLMICEPGIHRQSAITLSKKRDALGMRRLKLNWYLSDEDYLGAERFVGLLGRALGSQGLGRIQRTVYFEGKRRRNLTANMHHMGTTRMSDDSRYGVVNPDCLVNGTNNLHIAGSSVFPRCGYSNPTLTIIALADKLARSLAQRG